MGPAKQNLYPLELSLRRVRKDWGGWPGNVGEIWSLSGPPQESLVLNGPLSGQRLTEVVGEFQQKLLGKDMELDPREPFPLLIKFTSAAKGLGIHVHPDDAFVSSHRLSTVGVDKLLYILHVEPGGLIYYGFKKKVSPERVREAVEEGSLHHLMNAVHAKAGEIFTVPGGRVHGISKGVTFLEVQRHSSLTYEVFSWDRKVRQKRHPDSRLDQALQAMAFNPIVPRPIPKISVPTAEGSMDYLACTARFFLRRFQVKGCMEISHSGERFAVYTGLRGSGWLKWGFSDLSSYIEPFQSVLVPAIAQDIFLEGDKKFEVLETSLADLTGDLLYHLLDLGVSKARIKDLGGDDYSPLLDKCLSRR